MTKAVDLMINTTKAELIALLANLPDDSTIVIDLTSLGDETRDYANVAQRIRDGDFFEIGSVTIVDDGADKPFAILSGA